MGLPCIKMPSTPAAVLDPLGKNTSFNFPHQERKQASISPFVSETREANKG